MLREFHVLESIDARATLMNSELSFQSTTTMSINSTTSISHTNCCATHLTIELNDVSLSKVTLKQ
jgi:hypothetical protein